MDQNHLYKIIRETVSLYIEEYDDDTNLLGITPVRNIIYILSDLEKGLSFVIDDFFINEVKQFSIDNLCKVIPKYLFQTANN
ncbi:hypothetical protein DCC85_01230 [Paenibacillus sp. CAA11]|uniref:hypothetical protein n=1 Tax=Paenibacillus sp. CAA11 TaxID=1532905 RepID=UPI000D36D54A|nr:hypothetical protein [Paenibacillus sp. CAA11]AWB42987.1 hypothetical protein DCC85_01230 [Paenibacillus sp. CAA11]